MLESNFQAKLIKKIEKRFEGCEIMKNDPNYKQGFPDLTILYGKNWAVLECKRSNKEKIEPNQMHYVTKLNKMSYSNFIEPENEEIVLNEMERILKS